MTRIELAHVIAADASSVALMLAGPAAQDLWPRPDLDQPASVRPVGAGPAGALDIQVDPPSRAGIGFTARVTVSAGEHNVGSGRLTIVPVGGDHGQCEVRLALTAADAASVALRHTAGRYLHNLGEVSRARSTAA